MKGAIFADAAIFFFVTTQMFFKFFSYYVHKNLLFFCFFFLLSIMFSSQIAIVSSVNGTAKLKNKKKTCITAGVTS